MKGLSLANQFYRLLNPGILLEGQQLKVFAGSESTQVKGHRGPVGAGYAPLGGSPKQLRPGGPCAEVTLGTCSS